MNEDRVQAEDSICVSHSLTRSSVACERCGDFLCAQCILHHRGALCGGCARSVRVFVYRRPAARFQRFGQFFRAGWILGLVLGGFAIFDEVGASSTERLQSFFVVFVSSIVALSTIAGLFLLAMWPLDSLFRQAYEERRRAISVLIARAANERLAGRILPEQCPLCQGEALEPAESLGPACLQLIGDILSTQPTPQSAS